MKHAVTDRDRCHHAMREALARGESSDADLIKAGIAGIGGNADIDEIVARMVLREFNITGAN
jgi:tartrate dehydratase beta subunit/fumarate hydratase class I family protein